MLRNVLAALAGYILMFVVVFVAFSLAYLVLGAGGAFQARSYEVTATWIVIAIVVSFVAVVGAGYVCRAIAGSDTGVKILVGVVLVLGLIAVIAELVAERPMEVRPDDVPMFEAMMKGVQPLWLTMLNPILGIAGVLYGGRLKSPAAEAV